MEKNNDIREIQELLLGVHALWHYKIEKPMKQLLDSGVSLEAYYCLQTVRYYPDGITMTELARWMNMPKQQLTRLVGRLVGLGLVTRGSDPRDRRVIIISAAKAADDYINSFLDNEMDYFGKLVKNLSESDREDVKKALFSLQRIFTE
ncbi:MAG: MarR family transcriptional regulator [Lachnospiraceae bacterium]|nr:MarR family transcriptional regulator [Ruminococcus sp.]MCM1274748.1 MarR family transcriptional regulator [Lachnospiraceae bacterium]